jgi:hypothetical protein
MAMDWPQLKLTYSACKSLRQPKVCQKTLLLSSTTIRDTDYKNISLSNMEDTICYVLCPAC